MTCRTWSQRLTSSSPPPRPRAVPPRAVPGWRPPPRDGDEWPRLRALRRRRADRVPPGSRPKWPSCGGCCSRCSDRELRGPRPPMGSRCLRGWGWRGVQTPQTYGLRTPAQPTRQRGGTAPRVASRSRPPPSLLPLRGHGQPIRCCAPCAASRAGAVRSRRVHRPVPLSSKCNAVSRHHAPCAGRSRPRTWTWSPCRLATPGQTPPQTALTTALVPLGHPLRRGAPQVSLCHVAPPPGHRGP